MAYAAHLNGFTRRDGRAHAWISRRANDKSIGSRQARQPRGRAHRRGNERRRDAAQGSLGRSGLGTRALGTLNCMSAVRVEYSVPEGLHREILFVHDLWLARLHAQQPGRRSLETAP
jgi:hypothetical protein